VDVIQFPLWRVFSYLDENGENVVRKWLDQNGVTAGLRYALQNWIDLLEGSEPGAIPGCIIKVSDEFDAFQGIRKGEANVYLVFCYGPFGDTEISLLVATHNPKASLAEARHNLAALGRDRRRRAYESITRTPARRLPE
jgi:hypothetical protein